MRRDATTRLARALCALTALSSSVLAAAQPAQLRGHVKIQQQYLDSPAGSLASSLGYANADATSVDLRLIGTLSTDRLRFEADYLLQAVAGSAVELENRLESLDPALFLDREAVQALDLAHTLTDTAHARAIQSLDRFSVSYANERWALDFGRQAYSWGNGIVFRPMDLFDPFPPDAVDPSYKPGVDALYAQRLFADGSDVAALVVPRRDPATGKISAQQSSAAVKWHTLGSTLDAELMLARDHLDTVVGVALSGSRAGAVWRLSVVPTRLDRGGTRVSLVANAERAWQSGPRNFNAYVEYFRNGFGHAGRGYRRDELAADLVSRLARGQVFNTGRDYFATGVTMQLTPLLDLAPTLILNVADRSALVLLEGGYSMAQNVMLDFGLRASLGPKGTEFGGLPVAVDGTVVDTPPLRVYARVAYYF